MVNQKELLATARTLYSLPNATNSDFDRSVSTAYYAVFSHICAQYCAMLFGVSYAGLSRARLQAYRAVSHTEAKAACFEVTKRIDYGFPDEIVLIAGIFITLQKFTKAANNIGLDEDPRVKPLTTPDNR